VEGKAPKGGSGRKSAACLQMPVYFALYANVTAFIFYYVFKTAYASAIDASACSERQRIFNTHGETKRSESSEWNRGKKKKGEEGKKRWRGDFHRSSRRRTARARENPRSAVLALLTWTLDLSREVKRKR